MDDVPFASSKTEVLLIIHLATSLTKCPLQRKVDECCKETAIVQFQESWLSLVICLVTI